MKVQKHLQIIGMTYYNIWQDANETCPYTALHNNSKQCGEIIAINDTNGVMVNSMQCLKLHTT